MSQTPPPPPPYPPNYRTPPQDDVVATLIPYKNTPALISYYIGLFSIFPCIGLFMGIVAVILGIRGLKLAARNPQAKGKAHAIVGIVCGSIFGLLWLLGDVLIVVGLIASRSR